MAINTLAVFCGSKNGNNPLFQEHAERLGVWLASQSIKLVYGGGNRGLMGAIANAVLDQGGSVIGIMPTLLANQERKHLSLTELVEVPDMHTRKKLMYERCDAALIMPGGYGTMDEFFEILTWNQLNIHDKKLYILNTAGYYDHLIAFILKMEESGFLSSDSSQIIIINSPEDLIFES